MSPVSKQTVSPARGVRGGVPVEVWRTEGGGAGVPGGSPAGIGGADQ